MKDDSLGILRDLFFASLEQPQGVKAIRFRIDHADDMDLIDDLLRKSYFTQQDRTYHLRLISIIKLADSVEEAKILLKNGEVIFALLKDFYRSAPDELIQLETLGERSGLSRKDVNSSIRYMRDAMLLGSHSGDFPDGEKATVAASEFVLRHKSYRDALNRVLEVHTAMEQSHRNYDVPALEQARLRSLSESITATGFDDFQFLLHEKIIESALRHFNDGDLRHAVLDALLAVFDLLRARSGLDEDGKALVEKAFSIENPMLVLSTLTTESGRSDQAGFIQILRGIYHGVRNPKSHSLDHDFTRLEAAQYLVFASLLINRIENAAMSRSGPGQQSNKE